MEDIYSQGKIVFQALQALIKAFNSAFLDADYMQQWESLQIALDKFSDSDK